MRRDTEVRIALAFVVVVLYFLLFVLSTELGGVASPPPPSGSCQQANPIPVPGGGECVSLGCRRMRGALIGYTWQCPPGWKVVNGQAVPWNL